MRAGWLSAIVVAVGVVAACGGAPARPPRSIAPRAAGSTSSASHLRVDVRGVRPLTGRVVAALFDDPEDFPRGERAIASRVVAATSDPTSVDFGGVREGRYAAVVYQDVDDDGALGTTIVGYPTEPFGFSNDASVRLFGPPTFESCAFDVRGPSTSITVTLVHHDE